MEEIGLFGWFNGTIDVTLVGLFGWTIVGLEDVNIAFVFKAKGNVDKFCVIEKNVIFKAKNKVNKFFAE